jgi:hypothetical protein
MTNKISAAGVKDNNVNIVNNGNDNDDGNSQDDDNDELEKEEIMGITKFLKIFTDFATTTTNPASPTRTSSTSANNNDNYNYNSNNNININTVQQEIWYIKYKTPSSFGKFWDIARFAINGQTRNSFQKQLNVLLQQQQKQKSKSKSKQKQHTINNNKHSKKMNSSFTIPSTNATTTSDSANTTTATTNATTAAADIASKVAILQRWLYLYPIDSYIGQFRSITIMRSAGTKLSNIMMEVEDGRIKSSSSSSSGHLRKQQKLSWNEFTYEYLNLARSTLEIQIMGNSLVHGDINEGNVMYDDEDDNDNDSDGNDNEVNDDDSTNTSNHNRNHLFLIDWDEATRPKPCCRKITNDEERMRYPKNLIDFPVQYTKQQLVHLFGSLIKKYYPIEAAKLTTTEQQASVAVDKDGDDVDVKKENNNNNNSARWMLPVILSSSLSSTASNTNANTSPSHGLVMSTCTVAKLNNARSLLSRSAVDDRFEAMIRYLDR